MENLQGAATITSALHYRIRSCQILVTGKQRQETRDKTRTRSGSGLAMYHVCANTAGLHAPAAMGLSGRLEFESSNHGLC